MGEIRRFFRFLRENFPKLAKILKLYQNFGVLHIRKDVTKKLIFTKLFPSFVVQNGLKIFGPNE